MNVVLIQETNGQFAARHLTGSYPSLDEMDRLIQGFQATRDQLVEHEWKLRSLASIYLAMAVEIVAQAEQVIPSICLESSERGAFLCFVRPCDNPERVASIRAASDLNELRNAMAKEIVGEVEILVIARTMQYHHLEWLLRFLLSNHQVRENWFCEGPVLSLVDYILSEVVGLRWTKGKEMKTDLR